MNIYGLEALIDDPRFPGFKMKDETSLLGLGPIYHDFAPLRIDSREWAGNPLASRWTPRMVLGPPQPENDFPMVYTIPAFSERAVDVLRDLLEPNGELLPLVVPAGRTPCYAFNITNVIDALDQIRSKYQRFTPTSMTMMFIDHFEFDAAKVGSAAVFRIPDKRTETFVNEEFVCRVRENKLAGMLIRKVWPLLVGTKWKHQPNVALRALSE